MAPAIATYTPRDPSHTVLYTVIAEHLETFLASLNDDPNATGLPAYVQQEFYDYLRCGILAHGFLRRVRGGVLPRWRRISSSRSSPGSPRGNGWCPCRSRYATGWRLRRTRLLWGAIVQEEDTPSTASLAAAVPLLALPGLAMSDNIGSLAVGIV